MPAEARVIDASAFGAALFNETASAEARRFLSAGVPLIAPDLLFAEIASLSAKKVWRGEAPPEAGPRALATLRDFIGEFVASEELAEGAFELAAKHRVSAYDGIYLALARTRGLRAVTLDDRLIARAQAAGLGALVCRPQEAL